MTVGESGSSEPLDGPVPQCEFLLALYPLFILVAVLT
jgi:hypothetical protein